MSYAWRDKIYRTQAEVAEAAGVHVNTVLRHLNQFGDLHSLATSRNGAPCKISIDGREWPTQVAFARFCGLHQSTVSEWLRDGRDDLMRRAVARADQRRGK